MSDRIVSQTIQYVRALQATVVVSTWASGKVTEQHIARKPGESTVVRSLPSPTPAAR